MENYRELVKDIPVEKYDTIRDALTNLGSGKCTSITNTDAFPKTDIFLLDDEYVVPLTVIRYGDAVSNIRVSCDYMVSLWISDTCLFRDIGNRSPEGINESIPIIALHHTAVYFLLHLKQDIARFLSGDITVTYDCIFFDTALRYHVGRSYLSLSYPEKEVIVKHGIIERDDSELRKYTIRKLVRNDTCENEVVGSLTFFEPDFIYDLEFSVTDSSSVINKVDIVIGGDVAFSTHPTIGTAAISEIVSENKIPLAYITLHTVNAKVYLDTPLPPDQFVVMEYKCLSNTNLRLEQNSYIGEFANGCELRCMGGMGYMYHKDKEHKKISERIGK